MIVDINQKYIYIVLTRTQTTPARIIRMISRQPYSHVSLAVEKSNFGAVHCYTKSDFVIHTQDAVDYVMISAMTQSNFCFTSSKQTVNTNLH